MSERIAGIFSWELLFWMPTLLDALLLLVTYGYCNHEGVLWYLNTQADAIAKQKETNDKKDDPKSNSSSAEAPINVTPEVHSVWVLAMAAYSAYACLFPLAIYWCTIEPQFRSSFCWAMTILMLIKTHTMIKGSADQTLNDSKTREGLNTLLFFYLPTYGGYAILKTFVL
mmetsp:Transcript_10107/g.14825  ORF Transcript_10107/g.14825 Transcript_10107/m.14825 type:complete len:170 (+) Transcript_10107:125-634(+)